MLCLQIYHLLTKQDVWVQGEGLFMCSGQFLVLPSFSLLFTQIGFSRIHPLVSGQMRLGSWWGILLEYWLRLYRWIKMRSPLGFWTCCVVVIFQFWNIVKPWYVTSSCRLSGRKWCELNEKCPIYIRSCQEWVSISFNTPPCPPPCQTVPPFRLVFKAADNYSNILKAILAP